jgi:subtilisin family serine protease
MATDPQPRLYAVLKATPALNEIYSSSALDKLTDYTKSLLSRPPFSAPTDLATSFRAVGAPSRDWITAFVGDEDQSPVPLDELVVVYAFDDSKHQQDFIELVTDKLTPDADILEVGVDIGVGTADHWCPGRATMAMFGKRADARRTISADALSGQVLFGQNVNVVIIDEGLDKDAIKPGNWGGGLNWIGNPANPVKVGTASRTSHGMMIARSVLDLAPGAVLYDVPLLPERIASVSGFFSGTSSAQAVFQIILAKVTSLRRHPRWAGPWILVNAWAIFDRSTEIPLGDYTENKAPGGHPLINKIRRAINRSHFDVIFAAGNCGEFCPSNRCGDVDRGPGHSIWGANALPEVITAGAVLTDETWVGYSSQGPGPNINRLARDKPDFCAPSDFSETNDAAVRNSGTSTACAVTAGVVAALRSNPAWNQTAVRPNQMRKALITSARQTHGPGWSPRLGHGILDAAAAIGKLP